MIRRLMLSLILVVVAIGGGVWFLVNHARQTVEAAAAAKVQGLPKILGEIKPVATFTRISFDAEALSRIDFKLSYTLGESGEVKDVPGIPSAQWRARPWDSVEFQTAIGGVR